MRWTYETICKAGSAVVPQLLVLSGVLTVAGCLDNNAEPGKEKVDVALAALMEDGTLPASMQGGMVPSELPPRFCGDNGFRFPFPGDGSDGGVIVSPPSPMSGSGSSGTAIPGAKNAGVPAPGPMTGAGGSTSGAAGSSSGTGGSTAGGGMGGGGGSGDPDGGVSASCDGVPIGFWRFDDCNTERTDLQDSSFQGHTAFRNVALRCAGGQEGQAVSFTATGDMVYAPDQPDFVLDQGVTLAAWVKPSRVDGTYTIFRKRDDANSAVALVINGKKFQFVVKLASGKLVTVSAPAQARQVDPRRSDLRRRGPAAVQGWQ